MKETRQILQFLRKHRMQKKKLLYKKAAGVAFDWVIMIYLAIFVGIGLWAAYDVVQESIPILATYQAVIHDVLYLMLMAWIVLMITFSFVAPVLPFTVNNIWLHLFWRRIGLRVFLFSLVAIGIASFARTPHWIWYGKLLAILVLTVLPQWYFFQLGVWKKLLLAIGGVTAMAGTRMLWFFYEMDITWGWITILAFANLWI
ncbi:hypothetical protein [Gracilibacillus phocaeensis]|uniref:hypothetical protein n=1 Tax=Gracilibacillus phocaeensis TaxID=2042304 RepID=UPI00102F8011|nr:hypothetical protein [Gracilibacillus phocaeensis]